MTKFLLPLIAVAAFVLPAQQAKAGGDGDVYYRHRSYRSRPVVVYEDDCRRPCYSYRTYRSYSRPVRVYREHDYGCYAPRRTVVVSRPRFAFSFGF